MNRKQLVLVVPLVLLLMLGGLWFWRIWGEPWWVKNPPRVGSLEEVAADLTFPLALPTWTGGQKAGSVQRFGAPGEEIRVSFHKGSWIGPAVPQVDYIQSVWGFTSAREWVGEVERETVTVQGAAATLQSGRTTSLTLIVPKEGGRSDHIPVETVPTVLLTWEREGIHYGLEGRNVSAEMVVRMAESVREVEEERGP